MRDFGKLCGQVVHVGAAGACAARIVVFLHVRVLHVAGLRHEAVDHTVERHVVIGTCARQFFHPRTMGGGHIGQQLDNHVTPCQGHDDCVFGIFDIGHWGAPLQNNFEALHMAQMQLCQGSRLTCRDICRNDTINTPNPGG